MAGNKIRTLIVDDSKFFREFLTRTLGADDHIEIVGVAADAFEADRMIAQTSPDVITLDMEMPQMRGEEFLRTVLPKYPGTKAVVISGIPKNVFEALQAGAADFVPKPNTRQGFDNAAFVAEALSKIRIAYASVNLRGRAFAQGKVREEAARPPVQGLVYSNPKTVIAIGASTGGTEAILAVLRDLPRNMPGIVIVQHMPPGFTQMYAERLDGICKVRVREARTGDRVETGLVLIAAGDRQMRLRKDANGYYVLCEGTDKVSGHCPSVDVLFDSVAASAAANAIGVILTGMGADGAKGLLAMKNAGAYTIGQNEETCVVYGMPMMAYKAGAVKDQYALNMIGSAILRRLTGR